MGITGVNSELVQHAGNVEFLSIGSSIHKEGAVGQTETLEFTSSADGQELYCQIDAGFKPLKFAFGNVAYSIGVGGGIAGAACGGWCGERWWSIPTSSIRRGTWRCSGSARMRRARGRTRWWGLRRRSFRSGGCRRW